MNGDALKWTAVATSTYVRELKTGQHELRLTGAPRPFDNDSRSSKRARPGLRVYVKDAPAAGGGRPGSALMMRAPRPRVAKLNAQLMSTSRRFWKPTR